MMEGHREEDGKLAGLVQGLSHGLTSDSALCHFNAAANAVVSQQRQQQGFAKSVRRRRRRKAPQSFPFSLHRPKTAFTKGNRTGRAGCDPDRAMGAC
jgi:hypothetical protein